MRSRWTHRSLREKQPVQEQFKAPDPVRAPVVSWNINKVNTVSAPVAPKVEEAKATAGYQSLASLASQVTSSDTEAVEVKKPRVIIAGNKTCPTDPAELAQCDSCQ